VIDRQATEEERFAVLLGDADIPVPVLPGSVRRRDRSIDVTDDLLLPGNELEIERRVEDLSEEALDLAGPALRLSVRAYFTPGIGIAIRACFWSIR
jgi:hypothetical protein